MEFFGKSVFTCPHCDAYEFRGAPIVVYGQGERGLEMARAPTAWTHDVVLRSDRPSGLAAVPGAA